MFKRWLLCLMALLMLLSSAMADAPFRVMVDGEWLEEDLLSKMEEAGLIKLLEAENVVSEIEHAFATKNGEIDIFVFPADGGLDAVKKNGYYARLNGAKRLMKQLSDFYPTVQRALTAENGDLAAWVLGAQVMGMTLNQTTVLEDNDLLPPTTFGELLNCCQAILQADKLPAGMTLFSNHAYTRASLLELYMDQYIRASQLDGGMVNFNTPDFVAMAERISSELPDHDPAFDKGTPDRAVFSYPVGFPLIDKDMLAMPQVLPGKAGLVDVYLSVAVVNPYSKRRKAAIDYMNRSFWGSRIPSYIYDQSLDQGLRNMKASINIEDLDEHIAMLQALEERTDDQEEELEKLLALYDTGWMISPDDVAAYQGLSDGISILDGSAVCYDDALRTVASQYLSGAFDAEGFARACQEHIDMIYQENGIEIN